MDQCEAVGVAVGVAVCVAMEQCEAVGVAVCVAMEQWISAVEMEQCEAVCVVKFFSHINFYSEVL